MTDQKYSIEVHPRYGFRRLKPTPTAEDIARYFDQVFYGPEHKLFNQSALARQREDEAYNEAWREALMPKIERASGRSLAASKLLDVGCGYGQAMLHFRRKGTEVFGFDLSSDAVEHCRGEKLTVTQAGMETMRVFPDTRFDMVTMFNVFQYVPDPEAILAELRSSVLAPGGVLVLEVPNDFNPLQLHAQRVHDLPEWWVAPPVHINYFSHSSLANLLKGTGYGVAVLESSFPLEMFLLMGENYVENPELGRACHRKRVAFETNLWRQGGAEALDSFYAALARANLGRHVIAIARAE